MSIGGGAETRYPPFRTDVDYSIYLKCQTPELAWVIHQAGGRLWKQNMNSSTLVRHSRNHGLRHL